MEDCKLRALCFLIFQVFLLAGYTIAQTKSQPVSQPASQANAQATTQGDLSPEEIIRKFTEKEEEFYTAWMQYAYVQTAVIRVLSVDGAPQKDKMVRVYEVVFNDDGSREVKLVRNSGFLRAVRFSPEDDEVIQNINPFALSKTELPLYNLKYEGKEKADELNCYVFSVTPKSTKGGRLYFKGKIWVDDQDLQVVKTIGKPVPQQRDNQFPEFETIRKVIDNKYWFPVWTHADSKLRFPEQEVRIEETITYGDYKRFGSDATIQFDTDSKK
jgi:hypothetical protein